MRESCWIARLHLYIYLLFCTTYCSMSASVDSTRLPSDV
jgi:hypothetical protein